MLFNPSTIETLRQRAELGHRQIAEGRGHTTEEVLCACRRQERAEAV
jgi:hypothetical protein